MRKSVPFRAMLRVAADAARLAFLRPLPEGRPAESWLAVMVAVLGSVAVPIVTAFVDVGLKGQWNWFGLSSALLHVPLLLGAAILIAYAIGRPGEVPRILVAGLLIVLVIDCVSAGMMMALSAIPIWNRVVARFQWFGAAWLALALAVFACRLVGRGARRVAVIASCTVLIALPLASVYRDRSLWYAPYDAGDDARGGPFGPAAEDVYYKQPALLAQELRALRPASEGRINVFFIGVAGYGGQNVFRREVDSVDRIVRQRFAAEGHTIRLINNRETLLDVPIASKTSLSAALQRTAEMMDRDRDVLVLYMTSHGSEDHHFSVQLWPLSFHEIDPQALRAMLDESGIRNRIVIISACYSGGFVKPLENADTLVITASASNRNSFGCSNEADWTYFGKAYFDEALRQTHSFTKAFVLAKPKIEERERKEGFDPSQPQMAVGERIAAKLADLEHQLEGVAPSAGARSASGAARAVDKYDEYVRLMFTAGYSDELKAACEANLEMSSPRAMLAKDPAIFDGLDRSPSHWRRLSAAWSAYEKDLCSKAYDTKVIRNIYASKVRTTMPEVDLEPAITFLHTPEGARWIRADREAARQESIELGRVQAQISNDLYKRYLDEQGRILDDFRKASR